MASFDPNARGYDPGLRNYRLTVYVGFLAGLTFFLGGMLWGILDYLF